VVELRTKGLVSIVTPCLNGSAFLRATIASILNQSYPSIEYIFVDGGSTDASVKIALESGERIRILRLEGSSQARAINAGFEQASGEFVAFVNADDALEPSMVAEAIEALAAEPGAPYAYGRARFIDAAGEALGTYPVKPFSRDALMHECIVCQPATLIRADALERVGGLEEAYAYALDYDLWIRFAESQPPPAYRERIWASARMHANAKTFRDRELVYREVVSMVRRHYGYVPFSWIHAYAGYLVDGRDQFFEPPKGSLRRSLLTLAMGVRENGVQAPRFVAEFGRESLRLRHNARVHTA